MVAKGVLRGRLSAREEEREHRDDEPGDVRQHVRRVRHHGEAVCEQAADDLGEHECKAEHDAP